MLKMVMAAVFLAAATQIASPIAASSCTRLAAGFGVCADDPGGGGAVGIGATGRAPTGGGDGGSNSTPPDGSSDAAVVPGASEPSAGGNDLGGNPRQITDTLGSCIAGDRCRDADESPAPMPAITLRDLASFSPTSPSIHMEPDGWMLAGLPANFVALTGAQAQSPTSDGEVDDRSDAEEATGSLLGHPITVRFSPTTFTWVWGDGETDTVTTPGRTWADLGAPRFTETSTSHVYTERGSTTVGLRVAYAVDYSLGGDQWQRVVGTVTSSAEVDAYVGTAKTVIVGGDCLTDPRSPGC